MCMIIVKLFHCRTFNSIGAAQGFLKMATASKCVVATK